MTLLVKSGTNVVQHARESFPGRSAVCSRSPSPPPTRHSSLNLTTVAAVPPKMLIISLALLMRSPACCAQTRTMTRLNAAASLNLPAPRPPRPTLIDAPLDITNWGGSGQKHLAHDATGRGPRACPRAPSSSPMIDLAPTRDAGLHMMRHLALRCHLVLMHLAADV